MSVASMHLKTIRLWLSVWISSLLIHHCDAVFATDGKSQHSLNVRIQPVWIDETTLEFSRDLQDGSSERVRVSARSGDEQVVGAMSKQGDAVLRPGDPPNSINGGAPIVVCFKNESNERIKIAWVNSSGRVVSYGAIDAGESHVQPTYAGHVWRVESTESYYGWVMPWGNVATQEKSPVVISIRESVRPLSKPREMKTRIRIEGDQCFFRVDSARQSIDLPKLNDNQAWIRASLSPSGDVLAIWRRTDGLRENSSVLNSVKASGFRSSLETHTYPLPGDRLDAFKLFLFDVDSGDRLPNQLPVIDFGYPRVHWIDDDQLCVEKVDRGHQRFRLFSVDASSGQHRTVIDESTDTFIWTGHGPPVPLVTYLEDGTVIYASEKSGYRHLYRVDLETNSMIAITSGDFPVRKILHIDEELQFMDLLVSGYHIEQDPYHKHWMRVALDGSGGKVLTSADGDHSVRFSPTNEFAAVTQSRVDLPPIHELIRASDGAVIATLAVAKRSSKLGRMPTRFVAKGRDGKTDIHGIICFPKGYNSDDRSENASRYPVIESIYAGPHDAHVPKTYRESDWHKRLTDLGFVVVQIDGMGTAHRSKSFHDVCWKNLGDAGFPDRIAWLRAAAEDFPELDLSRVGIYGTSAGGQNACGALLFHGDFYKVAVASCGCHDNRMDKASWNEQWMGYPVDSSYENASNIENADRLQGELMLIVGEVDTNVPPESTLRLVDRLIDLEKDFEFLFIPGMGHSDGGEFGRKRREQFFIQHLRP
ncbi:MAG: prolyl oligopeptidase family serine peptidase [Planctomycetota bacterium]